MQAETGEPAIRYGDAQLRLTGHVKIPRMAGPRS